MAMVKRNLWMLLAFILVASAIVLGPQLGLFAGISVGNYGSCIPQPDTGCTLNGQQGIQSCTNGTWTDCQLVENPLNISINVTVNSTTCTPHYIYSNWSSCINSTESRTYFDENNCNSTVFTFDKICGRDINATETTWGMCSAESGCFFGQYTYFILAAIILLVLVIIFKK